jgi:peptidoglycan/LPS O-acetylase OafA/YrhL
LASLLGAGDLVQDGRGTADNHQTRYRSDIDGLRAIAVLSVIAYHLSAGFLGGGFLGVDIFFVISGYLITHVIWREAINRNLSIARFYERRVRRIVPAFLFVLIAVSAGSIALLLPVDLKGYAKSVFASLGFVANIYFWRETNYFLQLAEEKPLLHVWSLGVEEQFYIIFPLLVLLCVRWRRRALLPLTFALAVLSLLANILLVRMGGGMPAFYLLPMRAWEIGAGALLALASAGKIATPWLRHALATLAAALLIGSLCSKGAPEAVFGGMIPPALWAVLGTSLAIYLGNAGGSWLTHVLSSTPLERVGLISYSLYLWHWPVLVLTRYYLVRSDLSVVEMVIVVALMFALAAYSWRYIERPFRNRTISFGAVMTWVGSGCVVVVLISAAILAYNGFPSRFSAGAARINSAVGTEYRCNMDEYIAIGGSRGCLMSMPSRDPKDATVALLGNSHAQMYAPLVTDILRQGHRGGILIPLNGCLPLPDFNNSSMCMELAAKNLDAVENLPRVRVVILAMTWDFGDSMYTPAGQVTDARKTTVFTESLDRVIQSLEQRGKTVVLVGPIASPGWESASIVARQLGFGRKVVEPLFLPEQAFKAKQGDTIAHYASRSDILFIRPDLIQCKLGKCDYFRDGASLFADSSHIAEGALPLFRPVFEPALQDAFILSTLSKP